MVARTGGAVVDGTGGVVITTNMKEEKLYQSMWHKEYQQCLLCRCKYVVINTGVTLSNKIEN